MEKRGKWILFDLIPCVRVGKNYPAGVVRMSDELPWRDREDGRATGQPQGVESEAYLNGTSQGATPEDARKDGHIGGRSR